LNTTIPLELRKYAESVARSDYDSLSDYVRTLIKKDKSSREGSAYDSLLEALLNYLMSPASDEEGVGSPNDIDLLTKRLSTISSLFETGVRLREQKLKKEGRYHSESELSKRINNWIMSHVKNGEVPGLFEISEDRKTKLLNG
ncbi:MAG: hypothetical protein J5J00_08130, partial [Deltaproteobacteria bacterium]|nr:hypothetical protein [Deltaproteobacteria bacterium]